MHVCRMKQIRRSIRKAIRKDKRTSGTAPRQFIYMVAAGRSLVGLGALLNQLPRADFVAVTGLKIELTTNDVCKLTADNINNLARIYRLNRKLVSDLAGHADGLFKTDNVKHNVVIVNLLVRLILRGELTLFTLYATNLKKNFFSLFPLGLLFLLTLLPALLFLYFSVRLKVFRPLSGL